MALRHGPEAAVEEVEADAEVGVHEPFPVHAPVMDIVQPPRVQEPRAENRNPGHPEIFDVHTAEWPALLNVDGRGKFRA